MQELTAYIQTGRAPDDMAVRVLVVEGKSAIEDAFDVKEFATKHEAKKYILRAHPLATHVRAFRPAPGAEEMAAVHAVTEGQIRDHVKKTRNATRVRVKRNGEVHAYGRIPYRREIGWYLVSSRWDIAGEVAYGPR